jgi:hypothetical protein
LYRDPLSESCDRHRAAIVLVLIPALGAPFFTRVFSYKAQVVAVVKDGPSSASAFVRTDSRVN